MDMCSAYGGCARRIASEYGSFVSCVDLSKKANDSFDVVLSEDSFLHAGQYREGAIQEAARVLKPGGHFVFTDIMQSDDCDLDQIAPVYRRIQLDDMGSPAKYTKWAQ